MDNIYELLYMIRMDDSEALAALYRQMMPLQRSLVNAIIARYRPLELYREDLLQEARISLLTAVDCFREDQACSFRTFLALVTRRRIWSVLRHYSAGSLVQMHETVDLENTVSENECLYDMIPQNNPMLDPEYLLDFHLAYERLAAAVRQFTTEEKKVLACCLDQMSYEEASSDLGISRKAYDGRLQRMRRKVRQALQDED